MEPGKTDQGAALDGPFAATSGEGARASEGGESGPRVSRITVRHAMVDSPPTYQAQRVRSIRERMGLSQPLFAQALNVSVQTVRGWEQGIRVPDGSSERLLEIAEKHPGAVLEAVHTSYSAEATPFTDSATPQKQRKQGKKPGRGRGNR